MDKYHLKELWWGLALRGIVALLFGVAAVFWPALTLVTLVVLFSAFILVTGVIELFNGISSMGKGSRWYLRILIGILELGVGIYLVRHHAVTFNTFILLAGFILIIRGIIEAVSTLLDEGLNISQKTINFIIGIVAFVAGIIVLAQPQKNGVAFVWILGVFALVTGVLNVALAVDIKNLLDNAKK
jgi:uncharacterized membrane protein HdeD (DUF308 family)